MLAGKKVDAKVWLAEVSKVLGGKVSRGVVRCSDGSLTSLGFTQGGGKDDSCSGFAPNVDKLKEALEIAKSFYEAAI